MAKLTENTPANEIPKTQQEFPEEERVNEEIMDGYIKDWDRHHARFDALYPGGGIDQKPRVLGYLLYSAKEALGFNREQSIVPLEKETDREIDHDLELD